MRNERTNKNGGRKNSPVVKRFEKRERINTNSRKSHTNPSGTPPKE